MPPLGEGWVSPISSNEAKGAAGGGGSLLDKALFGAFLAALLLIVLVAGAMLSAAGIFPGPQVARAYHGGKAIYSKLTAYDDVYASDLWHPARSSERGVIVQDLARVGSRRRAEVEGVVDERGEQVVGGADGVDVSREV